jgi:FdhE protein
LLAGESSADDAAVVPFVGAALQVYFSRRAATLSPDDVSACDVATICPVCSARPVASLIRLGAAQQGLRYLHCAVCETEWHMVRIKCSSCESTKGINYLRALRDGQTPEQAERASKAAVVSAETCDECRSYLKLVNREKAQFADPVADDLATLALDMLVDERDYLRAGPNLLFHPGTG